MSSEKPPEKKSDPTPILEIRLPPRPPVSAWIWILLAFVLAGNLFAWILVARIRSRVVSSFEQAEKVEKWFDSMTAPGLRFAVLSPTPSGAPDLRGRAFHNPESKRTVFVFEKLEAPENQVFRLWAIRGQESASLGEIRPDENGYAVLRLDVAGNSDQLDAFAVSLEERGVLPEDGPAGVIVMLGALER